MQSLDPSYAPWSDRHDPVESTRQFGEGCVVLATCWVDLFTTFDWGRESQAHACVCVRACVRACVCVRARAYIFEQQVYIFTLRTHIRVFRRGSTSTQRPSRRSRTRDNGTCSFSEVSCRAGMRGCWTGLSSCPFDFYSVFVRRTGQARIKSLAKLIGQKWPPLWLTSPGLQAHRTWWMLMPMEASSSVSTGMVHPSLTTMPSSTRPGDRDRSPYLDRAAQNAPTTPDAVILALSRSGPGPLSVSSSSH